MHSQETATQGYPPASRREHSHYQRKFSEAGCFNRSTAQVCDLSRQHTLDRAMTGVHVFLWMSRISHSGHVAPSVTVI